MNSRIIAIVQMYDECSACMARNAPTIAGYQPLIDAASTLHSRIAVIQQTMTAREQNIKGYTEDKLAKRKLLAALTDVMRSKVQSVMLAHADMVGYKAAHFTYSDIYRVSALKAIASAEIVNAMANAVSAGDKTLYGITVTDLRDYETAIYNFKYANTNRRSSLVIKQTSGDVLEDLIKGTSTFVYTTMNALMGTFKVSSPEFYTDWVHSKTIIEPAQHHAQITGQVTDAMTEQPLQMVKVKATSGERVYEDMTDSEGKYKIPVNPEVWDVRFELPTYQPRDVTQVIVDSGERQKLNAKLVKSG